MRHLLAGLAAAALLPGLGLFFLVKRNLPGRGEGRVAGLGVAVTVDVDDRGIATIRAATVEDALRAQGWMTARDSRR